MNMTLTQLNNSLTTTTSSKAKEISLLLGQYKSETAVIASLPLLKEGDRTKIMPYLTEENKRTGHFEVLAIADLKGEDYVSNGKILNVADRDYFKKVLETKETVISDPVVSGSTGTQITVIATPIFNDNELVSVLIAMFTFR